jgi:hypothetical protein
VHSTAVHVALGMDACRMKRARVLAVAATHKGIRFMRGWLKAILLVAALALMVLVTVVVWAAWTGAENAGRAQRGTD